MEFHKYQGTGNDFVMIDNRKGDVLARHNADLIKQLCGRRFGIGADGLILLQNHPDYDFEMVYFNADGREGSMCGNGGRCAVAFAHRLGIIGQTTKFWAVDGLHEAKITPEGTWVDLKMIDVNAIEIGSDYFIMNTGSPHYVIFVEDIDDINVHEQGQAIRYSERFRKEGINVNFVEEHSEGLLVATYERGVEAETLSCGTGVTACAIAYSLRKGNATHNIPYQTPIQTKGGQLSVRFTFENGNIFSNVWLCGSAQHVFTGKV